MPFEHYFLKCPILLDYSELDQDRLNSLRVEFDTGGMEFDAT